MLLTFLLWPPVIWGQILPGEEDPDALKQLAPSYDEAGAPFFFEHFEPQDYRHYPQNWSIVQDQRGVIYVANFDGLLEYDGNQWRFIETATNMVVRSLALGHDGRLYVGTNGDFGYLAPDSTNTLRYRPLIDQIDPEHRTFSDVWGTHATAEGIYFQTSKHLFRWDGKQMKVWQSQAGFHTSFVVRGQFYVREFGVGLLQVVKGQLQLAPGGEHFAELGLFMMVPHAEDGILIGTSKQGFFLYRQGVATPFVTQADSLLKDFPLYHGCALPGGFYALATLGGGGLIIDQQGALVRVLDKDAGMPDNWVNFVYADAQGGLWMALDAAGIVRLDVSSQLTLYDDRLNLHGIINDLQRYGHTLYVGTSTGLSRLHRPASAAKRRLPVLVDVLEGLPTTALIATDSILFVATHEGLYVLRDGEPERLGGGTFFALLESRRFPGQIWVGQKKGLARLAYRSTGGWRLETVYEGKTPGDHIRFILEEHDSTLWLGAADGTIQRLRFSDEPGTFVRESFTEEDGLPEDFMGLASVDGAVVFVSEQGIYRFDGEAEDGAKFYRDPSLLAAEGSPSSPLRLFNQDGDGRLWAIYEDHVDIAVAQADGSYLYQTPAVLHFSKSMVNFYAEADGVAWISDGDRLVRYDAGVEQDYTTGFAALLRRVVATRTERVIYGGAPITGEETLLSLRHEDHDVRFEVSAPSYNDIRATRYKFYLEGYDETWSAWTPRTSRTYNDLDGGSYRLRVRARNGQGVLSAEAVFVFGVLPPWYRTWAAYLLYLVMMLAALAFSWHHYQVVQENRRAQIRESEWRAEATALQLQAAEAQARALQAENRRQEVELEKAREKAHLVEQLKRSNQELEQFASVASHDLREPLRTIRSFVQLLENRYQGRLDDDADTFIGYIVDGTDRMQALIRDILALSRVGRQEVEHQPVDMSVVLKQTLAAIQTALEEAKAEITYDPLPTVEGDATQLGLVLQNLISNSVKFRGEAAPRVHISALRRNGTWCFGVRDNGIGIKEDYQDKIFEVFKRLHSRSDYEGTGIGLAICKKIVEQHGGRIWVESQEGESTTFYFALPA